MDRQGRVLPSWNGGDYQPACMNHPDWRACQMYNIVEMSKVEDLVVVEDMSSQPRVAVGKPSLTVHGPPAVRAVVRDQPARTIIHVFNVNVERLSSFENRVNAADDIQMTIRIPFPAVRTVSVRTADAGGTSGELKFTTQREGDGTLLNISIPRLEISAIAVVER